MLRFLLISLVALLLAPLLSTSALAKATSSSAQIHVVKQGDTLYDIARLNGLTVTALKQLNSLSSNRLKLGQKLALNRAAAPPATQATVKKSGPAVIAKKSAGKAIHVVKKGDTLFTIARRHQLTVEELKRLNRLHDSKLKPGQTLTLAGAAETKSLVAMRSKLPTTDAHRVKKGDTLNAIARRHGTTVAELKRLNGLRSNHLKIGQHLALADPGDEPSPLLLPGDASEDEVLGMVDTAGSELEQAAFGFLATPYRFGGNSRKGIDCSAFVQQVFREVDVALPRSAREQFRVGEKVERDDLQPGDLLFFHTYAKFPSHVGIYLGEGKMIHASSRSHRVVVTSIDYPYYRKRFIGAKRISLLDEDTDGTPSPVQVIEPIDGEAVTVAQLTDEKSMAMPVDNTSPEVKKTPEVTVAAGAASPANTDSTPTALAPAN